jgi:OOP family OmpA-OmpF porin
VLKDGARGGAVSDVRWPRVVAAGAVLFVACTTAAPGVPPPKQTAVAPDSDGDMLPDHADRCPTQPEDIDGYQDNDGCPDPDNDRDGIPDRVDKCPRTGRWHCDWLVENPVVDKDGCCVPPTPKNPMPFIRPIPPVITYLPPDVFTYVFSFGSNSVAISRKKRPRLDAVAAQLVELEGFRVRIEGHCDTREKNPDELSLKRAKAVKDYLVAKGVSAYRLEIVGYGAKRPIAENTTRRGRVRNRRVEFVQMR